MPTHSSRNRMPVVLPLLAASIVAICTVLLPNGAAVLWIATMALLIVATIAALVTSQQSNRVGRPVLVVTAFIVAAALGAGVVLQATDSVATAGVPSELKLNIQEGARVQTVARKPERVTLDQAGRKQVEAQATATFTDTLSEATVVTGARADKFIAAAQTANYQPLSGLTQSFEDAVVAHIGEAEYITVPLSGTDIPEMTKVVYVYDGHTTSTFEMVSNLTDAAHAQFQMWQDGVSLKSVELYDPNLDTANASGTVVVQAGFSWSKLNKCLSNAGISAWIVALVGSACAVGCAITAGAGCVACVVGVAGFAGGSVAGCVYLASK